MTEQSFANVRNCFRAGALCVVGGAEPGTVCDQAQPDSTKVNKRYKNPDEATADQQKMNAADGSDREDPQIGDGRQDTLHIRSHRQIISQNGIVTLKGQFVQTTKLHDWFGDGQCAFAVHYQSPLGD